MKLPVDMQTYIIADTHFGHENIVKHEPIRKITAQNSGYSDVDTFMVDRWNHKVQPNDIVLHLGDFAFKCQNLEQLATSLNGNKMLIIGNHDKQKDIEILQDNGWKVIDKIVLDISDEKRNDKLLKMIEKKFKISDKLKSMLACLVCDIDKNRIMFTHFPLYNENPYDEKYIPIVKILEFIYESLDCTLNIHGHTHSLDSKKECTINVSVEQTNLEPIQLQNIFNLNCQL